VGESFKPGPKANCGKLQVPAAAGSAYLKAERDSVRAGSPAQVRVVWKATADMKEMTVPAGEYRVINYWLYRQGKDETERWMVSVTNVDGCTTLNIGGERTESVVFGNALFNNLTAERKALPGGLAFFTLNFALADDSGNRLTLSKNGRVVMPSYRVLDTEGAEIARAVFGVT
jgi:hypothetical protein